MSGLFWGEAVLRQIPLKRVDHPEEVAHTILILASRRAEFLTGGIVDVNFLGLTGWLYLRVPTAFIPEK